MTTIAFTGDAAFSQYFGDAWQSTAADEEVLSFLQSARYVVANIEGPVTDRPFQTDNLLQHASPAGAAGRLAQMHLNIWDLSNNHILDCGTGGVFDTVQAVEGCGCIPLGVGRTEDERPGPVIVDGGGCRVGILSAVDSWDAFAGKKWIVTTAEPAYLREQIRALRPDVDYVVVTVHDGREYASMPMPPERERYLRFLDWGADVVVAHHPHVVQNYEQVGDKLIFYSLGNFIFDTPTQRQFRYTDRGLLLRLTFSPAEKVTWTYLATRIDRQAHRVRAAGRPGEGAPAVFCEIGGREYGLLWPLAAKIYRENCREKQKLFPPSSGEEQSRLRRLVRKGKLLRYRDKRTMLYGRILAFLRIYRLSGRRDVLKYLAAGGQGTKSEEAL